MTEKELAHALIETLTFQYQSARATADEARGAIAAALRAYGMACARQERARCAGIPVLGSKKSTDPAYQAGWFDGVEDCQDAIRAQPREPD